MKAFVFPKWGGPDVIEEATVPKPVATGRDLLVKISAVGFNPIDTKKRSNRGNLAAPPPPAPGLIAGFDAVGIVESCGSDCTLFKPGMRVWYMGDVRRPGSYANYQLVDERLVGKAPAIDDGDAASMPLCGLTSYEAITECIGVPSDPSTMSLLIINGGGGVGTMAIQIAKVLGIGRVVATASRPETRAWCLGLGADEVIDHSKPLAPQWDVGKNGQPHGILIATTSDYWEQAIALIRPLGKICALTGRLKGDFDLSPLFFKSAGIQFESIFTRPMQGFEPERHGIFLNKLAGWVEEGRVVPKVTRRQSLTLAGVREAHALMDEGKMIGKMIGQMI